MTLNALLEELKRVDRPVWNKLVTWNVNLTLPETSPLSLFIIQGVLQRAIEGREGWEAVVWWQHGRWRALIRLPGGYTDMTKVFVEDGDSAAEALLVVYVAAVTKELRVKQ